MIRTSRLKEVNDVTSEMRRDLSQDEKTVPVI